jgi:hypothetical protein
MNERIEQISQVFHEDGVRFRSLKAEFCNDNLALYYWNDYLLENKKNIVDANGDRPSEEELENWEFKFCLESYDVIIRDEDNEPPTN